MRVNILLSIIICRTYILKFWPSKWYYNEFHRNLFKKDTDLRLYVIALSPLDMCRINICLPLSTASFPLFSLALHCMASLGLPVIPRKSSKLRKQYTLICTCMPLKCLEIFLERLNLPWKRGFFWEYLRSRP